MVRKMWAKRMAGALIALALLLALNGCGNKTPQGGPSASPTATQAAQPTEKPAAQLLPISPQPEEEAQRDERVVSLYYRLQGEDRLARETRTVYIPMDRQLERVLIESLIEGPSAEMLELVGLFVPGTQLVSLNWQGNVLLVTLSSDYLAAPPDAPADWQTNNAWQHEVITRRKLAAEAIVNTITEATDCEAIQLLVQSDEEGGHGRRIARAELYENEPDTVQLLGLMQRNEAIILTHYHTAGLLLQSWQQKDWRRLYRFVAQEGRPTANAFEQALSESARTLLSFSITPGHVSANGQSAVLNVQVELSLRDGSSELTDSIPLHMVVENGLWKVSYDMLLRLVEYGE